MFVLKGYFLTLVVVREVAAILQVYPESKNSSLVALWTCMLQNLTIGYDCPHPLGRIIHESREVQEEISILGLRPSPKLPVWPDSTSSDYNSLASHLPTIINIIQKSVTLRTLHMTLKCTRQCYLIRLFSIFRLSTLPSRSLANTTLWRK